MPQLQPARRALKMLAKLPALAACRAVAVATSWLSFFFKGWAVLGEQSASQVLLPTAPVEAEAEAEAPVKAPASRRPTQADSLAARRAAFDESLAKLRDLLRKPAPPAPKLSEEDVPRLSPEEVKAIVEGLVPEAGTWIAPRSNGTKAIDFLVKSYSHGFPALPAQLSRHCSEGVRLVVAALAHPERAGLRASRARAIAQDLAEAYTGCQAVQARTVDRLQGEVRGLTANCLPTQLRTLVQDHRERALDRTVCHFHPAAPTTSDGSPQQQLPHLANRYYRHLGASIGTSAERLGAASADRNATGPLPVPLEAAEARFWQEFDLAELCNTIVADVNQAGEDAERRIDRGLLSAWAGSHPEIGHRIFYDDDVAEVYGAAQPCPEQRALRQPFIHQQLACDILLSALAA